MHIEAINNAYCTNHSHSQQHFSGLIKDKSAISILNKMSKSDILELKKIEKKVSKTKFWDLKISGIKNKVEELKFEFIDKKNQHGIITDGIYPYEKEGDTIKIYSIIYGPKNISRNVVENLRFKSSARAQKVYNKYLQNLEFVKIRGYNLTPIESIKSKEIELNMLEEASHFAKESDTLKYLSTELSTKDSIGNGYKETAEGLLSSPLVF